MTASKVIGALITHIVQPLVKLMFIVAVLIFVWGVIQMIMNADNEEARQKGQKHITWGLVGLFIMFSVYGILNLLASSLLAVS